ncbi:biotin transporter BioY [Metaclostridioides mangenotii]|uniref:biotin transporter BioY n=1 Tax=Metaclostridioides mangenotii TaxID=1540 RepID=UPI0028E6C076|nr:biotin transporter BioY [Clostridioides mangenotii]
MQNNRAINTKELVLCSLFTAMIAIGAFIKIPIPFMDYFTLQFLFVILAGMILGPRLGTISVSIYIVIGLMGFPVFAAGGGIQYILKPSFGYLIGFSICVFVIGYICEKIKTTSFKQYLIISFIGMFFTYSIGFIYKYLILNLYMNEITPIGVIVLSAFPLDIPGDVILCIVGSSIANQLRHVLKKEYTL